jgi:hypothetical protein
VLDNLGEQIRLCLEHAADCAARAAAQTDPKIIGALELFGFLASMIVLYFLLQIYNRPSDNEHRNSGRSDLQPFPRKTGRLAKIR